MPVCSHAARRKPRSNGALWATSTAPRANSRKAGSTAAIRGAAVTIIVVMPVSTLMYGGISHPGSTSVWNSPSTWPPRTFTAPISVIAQSLGEPPVVSRSTTTNVTPDSGGADLLDRHLLVRGPPTGATPEPAGGAGRAVARGGR